MHDHPWAHAGDLKMWNFNSGAVLREYRHKCAALWCSSCVAMACMHVATRSAWAGQVNPCGWTSMQTHGCSGRCREGRKEITAVAFLAPASSGDGDDDSATEEGGESEDDEAPGSGGGRSDSGEEDEGEDEGPPSLVSSC